ncbi:MAG: carbohydrate kinase family protein [Acidobacteriaceae bacterium]|nr:carbohydrate kinase family protein [Acidobacteriaceae bacterium]
MRRFDITIAGEVNLDLILPGLPAALPEERELLATDFVSTLGSSSAILAHNLSILDAKVGFITAVGGDPFAGLAMEWLKSASVDLSKVVEFAAGKTGVTLLLPHGKTRHILTYPGVMAEMTVSDLDVDYLASGRHFHLSSLFLQTALQPGLPELFRTLKARGVTLSLDTNDDPEDRWGAPLEELLGLVDIFLPNEDEACRIAGTRDVDAALTYLAKRTPVVAIKCGRRGSLVQAGEDRWEVASQTVTPVDTIGAGDSFNSGFLKAYLNGSSWQRCAEWGNATAALSTLRAGGVEAFRDAELRSAFLQTALNPQVG